MPDLVQHLCARGAVVYGYDQRGSGLSLGDVAWALANTREFLFIQ